MLGEALCALALVGSTLAQISLPSNHSAATQPFWNGYNYCSDRTVTNTTWKPLQNATMVKLQVMHRHGARTPAAYIPSDNTSWYQCNNPGEYSYMSGSSVNQGSVLPLNEKTDIGGPFSYAIWKGNCDLGQLTNLGSIRMQELGQQLRSIYVDTAGFLPKQMDPQFNISHTYIWRTRESVENLFIGLYPAGYRGTNQTLAMRVKPQSIEIMLSNTATCPKLAALTTAYSASSQYAAVVAPYASLNARLYAAYNLTSNSTLAPSAGDSLSATYCHGLGLKGNITAAEVQTIMIGATASYHGLFRSGNPNATQAQTLGVGPWLTEILASFDDRSTKLQVYSAHDASLDMFLSVVADPDLPWPPFSSNVQIELWQHATQGQLVRIYYEGMIIPANPALNCSFTGCPLSTLQTYLRQFVPANLQQACATS